MRRLPPSRGRGQRVAPSPSAEPIVDGGGILDVVKNITKRTGRKAVNKLAEKVGRKIGKEVAVSIGKKNESAGDRIREILEANSITRMGHTSGPRDVQAKPIDERIQERRQARSGKASGKPLN